MAEYLRETLKQAGYKHVESIGEGEHILEDIETGRREIWACNKHYAGYAIRYKNTCLEFCRGLHPKGGL